MIVVNLPKQAATKQDGRLMQTALRQAVREMSSRYPEWEHWTVAVNWGDGTFDLVDATGDLTMSRVRCIDAQGIKTYTQGKTVLVGFYCRDRRRPYIKGLGGSIGSPPEADGGGIPIAVNAGTWLETGGFWRSGYASPHPCAPPNLSVTTVTVTETFAGAQVEAFNWFGVDGAYVVLAQKPADVDSVTTSRVKLNGTEINLANYQFIGGGRGNAFYGLTPVPNPPEVAEFPATFEVTYQYQVTGTTQISAGAPGAGPDTAFSPRGIALFPDPKTGDQMLAVLEADYRPRGGELIPTDAQESLSAGPGQYSLELAHEPMPGSLTAVFLGLEAADILYRAEPDGRALRAILGSVNWKNAGVDLSYLRADGSPQAVIAEDSVADGSSASFATSFSPVVALTEVRVNGVPDLLATFSNGAITLSTVPSAGAEVSIDYVYQPTLPQIDTFPASSTVTFAFDLSADPVGTVSASGFPVGALGVQCLVMGRRVRAAVQVPDGSEVQAQYQWLRESGQLFDIVGMRIRERNLTHPGLRELVLPFAEPFDATPDSQFLAYLGSVSSAQGKAWQDGWENQRWGFLAYDPTVDGYTVAAPPGLFWRSRVVGDKEGVHWTVSPWPEQQPVQDPLFVGWSYPADPRPGSWGAAGKVAGVSPDLKRRTAPYMGCGCAGRYAWQASWGPLGPQSIQRAPESYGGGQGAGGDRDYPLRFFRRSDKGVWGQAGLLSPRALVKGNRGQNPLYIPGCGIVHREGEGGFATGRPRQSLTNSWWPCTRDASAVLIGCGWCEGEWLRDVQPLETAEGWIQRPYGVPDAGWTLSAVDMAGRVRSQLTFKADPSYEELGYADPAGHVSWEVAHANDQFDYNPYESLGGLNFGMQTIYFAAEPWGYLPGYGYCFFYYALAAVDGPAKKPKLQYPGIPALADNPPRYSSDTYGSNAADYGKIRAEDNASSQKIAGDGADNFYFCLSIPFWVRGLDFVVRTVSETVRGTFTAAVSTVAPYHTAIPYACTGYAGVPIITRVRDKFVYPGDAPAYPTLNGAHHESYPQSGFYTPLQVTYNRQVMFVPSISAWDYSQDPPVLLPQRQDFSLSAPWEHIIPHRTNCSLRGTYDFGASGVHFYRIPGYTDIPPFVGAAIWDLTGDNRQNYGVSARTFLVKVNCRKRQLKEVWRLDVSERGRLFNSVRMSSGEVLEATTDVAKFFRVFFTRPIGRWVLLLRSIGVVAHVAGLTPPNEVGVEYLVLDAIANSAHPERKHRIYLPGLPDPLAYDTYRGIPQGLEMHEGMSEDGREWAEIVGTWHTLGGDYHARWVVKFGSGEVDSPTVVLGDEALGDLGPTQHNTQGQAEALGLYVWTTDDGAVKRRDGA